MKASIAAEGPFEVTEFPLRGADGKFRTFLTCVAIDRIGMAFRDASASSFSQLKQA